MARRGLFWSTGGLAIKGLRFSTKPKRFRSSSWSRWRFYKSGEKFFRASITRSLSAGNWLHRRANFCLKLAGSFFWLEPANRMRPLLGAQPFEYFHRAGLGPPRFVEQAETSPLSRSSQLTPLTLGRARSAYEGSQPQMISPCLQ